jgi:predicted outer membrane protein
MRTNRTVGPFAVAVAAALLISSGCRRDDRPLVIDTAGGGLADSAPVAMASGVVAILSDENVFALLDTAYAAIIETDKLAQTTTTDSRIRDFAAGDISAYTLARSGVKATAERLHITSVLPDRDVIRDQAEAMQELRGKRGAEFDRLYLDRVVATRDALIDEINDALEGNRPRQPGVVEFLREMRTNLEAEKQKALDLRRTLGG